jgi:hypothetical protein
MLAQRLSRAASGGIMAVDEQARHELYNRLVETLGPTHTRTLMEHLPPVGWADVATKRDLDDLRVATKGDLDELRVATKRDLDDLRGATKRDLDDLRVATKRDLESGLDILRLEIKATQHETIATLRTEINAQTRLLFFSMLTVMFTAVALAFTAARFA